MARQQNGTMPGVINSGWPVMEKLFSNGFQLALVWTGAAAALISIWLNGLSWVEASAFLIFYVLTGIGVGVGLHRYFTHKSYEARPSVRWVIGALGSMAWQGTIARWVSDHRRHHAHADRPGDPHSPHFHSDGQSIGGMRGLMHAHFGWFLDGSTTDMAVYGKGLMADPVVGFYSRTYWFWAFASLALPWLYGYAFGGIEMAWRTLLVGGFLRISFLHHVTWAVNSFGHRYGTQNFPDSDGSRNNLPLALLTFGDGWHNNHHRFPRSASHGLLPGEIDMNAMIIYTLERLGLVRNVVRLDPDYVRRQAVRAGGAYAPSSADISFGKNSSYAVRSTVSGATVAAPSTVIESPPV